LEDKGSKGYLFDVDLEYPKELHDLHNGYALAPENINIKNEMLNDWQTVNRKDSKIKKLVISFYDKVNYGINYRLLKLYLKLGLKIKNVNRVLEYTQSNFMESYIMKNTNERKQAKNEFEKDFYKLMNNSVYGKTMENVRNRINFKLLSCEKDALKLINTIKKRTIFNENCVGVHLLKKEVKLNKPIFIGQCVLDESKLLMYDFHYNFMLENFDRKNIDLLFTDTDSLCYHIKNQNPYETIKNNKNLFDLSAYPKNHEMYDDINDKVIGKFKDEAIDDSVSYIKEFVGLRSKLYSYSIELDNKINEEHKCKGIKKSVISKDLSTALYKEILFNRQNYKVNQNGFRSHKHQIFTEQISKIALSANDDKCFITNNNVITYTHGHYKIMK
jgi:ribosomal protein L31E